MIHLYRYRHFDIEALGDMPYDMTQDGIGEALNISRSYASLILGRMNRDGLLRSGRAMVITGSGRAPRKVYTLSDLGLRICERLLQERDAEVLVPRTINRCCTSDFDNLNAEDRDMLGAIMVIHAPVHFSQIPKGRDHPLLPVDAGGFVCIRPSTRKLYRDRADAETLRRWHSIAADWCADNGVGIDERLEHLEGSGRRTEAVKLAMVNCYTIMDRPNNETVSAIDRLATYAADPMLSAVAAFAFLRLGRTGKARRSLDRMAGSDDCLKGAILSEIMLVEGKTSNALDQALDVYRGDVPTALALGKCMAVNGRHPEAVVYLRKSRQSMSETGCLFRLDEALRWEGESYLAMGDTDIAARLLEAASCATRDDKTSWMLRTRARSIQSQDGVGLQGVHVRDVQVPDVLDAPFEHGQPLEPESPCEDGVLDAERGHDLGPEYAGASELHPFAVEEDLELQRGLGVREVRGPYADLVEPHPGVELADE